MEGLRAVPDPSVGDWIAPRLRGGFGAVCRTVPRGFTAYARVLHPVDPAPHDGPTTWAGVCRRTGRTAHAAMQWEAVTTPAPGVDLPVSREGRWDDVQVERGSLAPQALGPPLDVLASWTTDPDGQQACHHALWEGWGWLTGTSTLVVFFHDGPGPHAPAPVPAAPPDVLEEALGLPRLSLPGREHLLFTGPLRSALAVGHQVTDDWFLPQSPNLRGYLPLAGAGRPTAPGAWPARSTSTPPCSAARPSWSTPSWRRPAWRRGRSTRTTTCPPSPTTSTPDAPPPRAAAHRFAVPARHPRSAAANVSHRAGSPLS